MTEYRNVVDAFVGELRDIRANGHQIQVRDRATQELLARTITLTNPRERCLTVPGRRNNIIASIAESVWVLAGRDDIAFLDPYLPRARQFSDDGSTWRGAYGPRLRDWNGIDQVAEVLKILQEDPASRRAVITIFDPDRDFTVSKDIPCNSLLHFLVRDGRLEMFVTIRSNDIWWGFSGINTFEWSVLHEAMARWLEVDIGSVNYFVSSLHLYDDFYDKADSVLKSPAPKHAYDYGWRAQPFSTTFSDLPEALDSWFALESQLRNGHDPLDTIRGFPDLLLRDFLLAIRVGWIRDSGAGDDTVRQALTELQDSDLRFALQELIYRDSQQMAHPTSP